VHREFIGYGHIVRFTRLVAEMIRQLTHLGVIFERHVVAGRADANTDQTAVGNEA
jgi:hypothetical protein